MVFMQQIFPNECNFNVQWNHFPVFGCHFFENGLRYFLIHDMALYHSDYTIDIKERTALFQVKQVADNLTKKKQRPVIVGKLLFIINSF
jgi:hypothetical protein